MTVAVEGQVIRFQRAGKQHLRSEQAGDRQ
jgi:hypothetical protein